MIQSEVAWACFVRIKKPTSWKFKLQIGWSKKGPLRNIYQKKYKLQFMF